VADLADNSVVSSSFNTSRPAKAKKAPEGGFFSSFRLRASIVVALICGLSVFGSANWMARQELQRTGLEIASRLELHAGDLQNRIEADLQNGNDPQASLNMALRNLPKLGVQVFDIKGEQIASSGDVSLQTLEKIKFPRSLSDGKVAALSGALVNQQIIELSRSLEGQLGTLGTVRLRQSQQELTWLIGIEKIAMAFGGLSFLLGLMIFSRSFSPMKALNHSLERVSKSDFSHRVPVSGCAELKSYARKFNDTLSQLEQANLQVQKVYVESALAMSRTVEAKDKYTSGHSQRVSNYCVEMGQWLGFDHDRLETIRLGALLHDIGKVAVADAVLCKQGPLDDDEFAQMRSHPMAGDRILGTLPGLRDIADIARSHHERWDGRGYPLGAKGESIPLEGRICAIADAYDALITKRSYKQAMPLEKALQIIEKDAGTHFDPELAKLFVAMKRNGKGYKSLTKDSRNGDNQRPNVPHPPTRIS